jgi:CRISPR-associated protein Cas5h
LKGKRAHFRRFYTNSSALTYPVPPPATLQGLLGAALGLGREYREKLTGLFLAARPRAPMRTLFQTVNHLFLKSGTLEEIRGLYKEGRTQIPVQYLVGEGEGPVAFEVFVGAEGRLVEDIAKALENPVFPLALGPAYALAWVEGVEFLEAELKPSWDGEGIGWWEAEKLELYPSQDVRLYRDRFPIALEPDRRPKAVKEIALELRGEPLKVRYRGEVLVCPGLAIGVLRV